MLYFIRKKGVKVMKKYILESRLFHSPHSFSRNRIVKDYEIDIECIDGRDYTYNGIKYKLKHGDILVRTPGGVVSSVGSQKTFLLTLDFSREICECVYSRNLPGDIQSKTNNELISNLPDILHPRNPYALLEIYKKLSRMPNLNSDSANALVDELLFLLNADLSHEKYIKTASGNGTVDTIIHYMESHLKEKISLDLLSKISNLEKSYLIRFFKKETGSTPFEVLSTMRLNRASDLLATTNMKVNEII